MTQATELNRTFSKEEIQIAKIHMKKCSPSLALKEIQIKTKLRFYLIPVKIATIKNTNNILTWQGRYHDHKEYQQQQMLARM
jgi:hypothetical protein